MLPTGEVKEFSGAELDLISDARGITGFISEVTVRVQELYDLETVALKAANASDMQRLSETRNTACYAAGDRLS